MISDWDIYRWYVDGNHSLYQTSEHFEIEIEDVYILIREQDALAI